LSAGFPSYTHKTITKGTGFPSNALPLQAGWALRAEEDKHCSRTMANNPAIFE